MPGGGEAKIGAVFTEAEQSRQEAQTAAETQKNRLGELEAGYEEMLNKTRQDAEAYHQQLLEKAREEGATLEDALDGGHPFCNGQTSCRNCAVWWASRSTL